MKAQEEDENRIDTPVPDEMYRYMIKPTEVKEALPKGFYHAYFGTQITYCDSVTGKHLFTAPTERSLDSFISESRKEGRLVFRDQEVNWEYVRVLDNNDCVSVDGTYLGKYDPDRFGNKYSINLACVAGKCINNECATCYPKPA